MTYRIAIRRDLATNWTSANPTLAQGEMGYETDTGKLKIGDGTSSWTTLGYFTTDVPSSLSVNDITTTAGIQVGTDLNVDGLTQLDETQIVGNVNLTGDLDMTGGLDVTGVSDLDSTNIVGTLGVTGNSTLDGSVTVTNGLEVTGGLTQLDAVIIDGLGVSTNTLMSGDLDVVGNLDVDGVTNLDDTNVVGTLDVTGITHLDQTEIVGDLTVTGSSRVTVDSLVEGEFDALGVAQFGNNVTVSGDLLVNGMSATVNNLKVGGSTGPIWETGPGSPEGVVLAPVGSIYSRTDATTGHDALWIKEEGTGTANGWFKVTTTVVTRSGATVKVV